MKQYQPFSPVEISIVTRGEAIEYLGRLISYGGKTLILASNGRIAGLGLDQWLSNVKKAGDIVHHGRVPVNPTISDVYESLFLLREIRADRIIAIGGGSCIDLAKAISALHSLIPVGSLSKESVRDAIKKKEYLNEHRFIDVIAVPTTSGTGSEVTKWATIWDMDNVEKLSIDCMGLFPKAAVLVPEFTASMNGRLTLSTGLDALSHAMEAFWSKSRTPLAQALAITAINYIKEYLPLVLKNRNDIDMRRMMCVAALIAGLSFSITRTTACHSISYPLTMCFGMEHGFAAAMTLAQVAERNEAAVPEISQIYSVFGGKDGFSRWLKDVTQPVQELRLSAFSISGSDLDFIVEKTFTQGRMDNNPIIFSPEEVKEILRQVL
ncbi:MAG: phosphonoacetaldehyde reductase [Caulobacteraceae bacterium]